MTVPHELARLVAEDLSECLNFSHAIALGRAKDLATEFHAVAQRLLLPERPSILMGANWNVDLSQVTPSITEIESLLAAGLCDARLQSACSDLSILADLLNQAGGPE